MYTREIDQWEWRKAETERCGFRNNLKKKLVIVFKEASKNFVNIFLLNKVGKNFQNHLRMYRKYLIVKAFKKYSSVEPNPLNWG